jgi:predicted transcriptional regulator
MQRTTVNSSHVASIGYEDGMLEVVYASGMTYQYSNISERTYQRIISGESPGIALRTAIHKPGVVGTRSNPGKSPEDLWELP